MFRNTASKYCYAIVFRSCTFRVRNKRPAQSFCAAATTGAASAKSDSTPPSVSSTGSTPAGATPTTTRHSSSLATNARPNGDTRYDTSAHAGSRSARKKTGDICGADIKRMDFDVRRADSG